jgi:hypothetical protein
MTDGPHERNEQRNRNANQEEVPNMPQKIWAFLFAGKSAAWTAVFTAILTLFTYKMYQVANTTSELARASERAFLSFSGYALGVRLNGPDGKWAGQQIFINWTNSGSTPAKDAVIQSNGQPSFTELTKSFDFPLSADKTVAVIGPKGAQNTTVTIQKEVFEQVWQGKARLFVWGTAIYKDIFPNDPDRLSEFCAEITHVTLGYISQPTVPPPPVKGAATAPIAPPAPISFNDPNAGLIAFQWQSCRAHNCYDEDCKDYPDRLKDIR